MPERESCPMNPDLKQPQVHITVHVFGIEVPVAPSWFYHMHVSKVTEDCYQLPPVYVSEALFWGV